MNKKDYLSSKNKSADTNQIIAKTEYKVFNVSYSVEPAQLNYSEPTLTWLPDGISDKNKKSISLQELELRINSYKKQDEKSEKINNSGFLKGLYSGYYVGKNCSVSVPYLCYDIDVKQSGNPDENPHLMNPVKNKRIFEALKKISVLCWKSNSGYGIAGILYVPQIAQYTNDTKDKHSKVGKLITSFVSNYLHNTTGVERVILDQTQSKFRQVRLVADQLGIKRKLNPTPFAFKYISEVVEKKTQTGVIKYRYSDYRQPANSIFTQFNKDNSILDILVSNGFTVVDNSGGKTRVKHHSSESSTSGFVDVYANRYINFSSSFDSSGKIAFRPSDIVCKLQFNNDWRKFAKHLYDNGYKEKELNQQEIKCASKSLKDELEGVVEVAKASKIIFKHCFDLKFANNEVKRQFIADNCIQPGLRKYFYAHLNFTDYKIQYNKQLIIDEYVSEVLPNILEFVDKHHRVILRADTGRGKTTAFIRYFHKHRPNERILILAPLTIIVDQYKNEYSNDAVFLTGQSDGFDHEKATSARTVFSTYEQGTKHLEGQKFDYIVIDEVHQLLTANSFKADVIADLTSLINDTNTIGLTGTPSQIFTQLDFKLLDVDVELPILMEGETRLSNKGVSNIVMSHLMGSPKGKVLIRVNAIETSKAIIKELVDKKIYKKSEILPLYSSKEIKESNNYKGLAHQRRFFDQYKIVFTTSMIDEGISIDQIGFTDVVFIETTYEPRPEPIKQFFARFRNEDPNRKNYIYLRQRNLQLPTGFKPEQMFDRDLETLINEGDQEEARDVLTTFRNLFSNNRYYYRDATTNRFYLAFAVTQVLFRQLNIEQFLDYLKSNYFLSFKVNDDHKVEKLNLNDKDYKKKLRRRVANYWIEERSQIYQTLLYHSQNPYITKSITKQQVGIKNDVELFAKENIKLFEMLFLREKELKKLGVEKPLEELIIKDGDELTLLSNSKYNQLVNVLKVDQAVKRPKNAADKRTANNFLHLSHWCVLKKEFKLQQMYEELRKLGVVNYKAYCNENTLCEIMNKVFNLEVKRNNNTNLIICKERVGTKNGSSIRK